MYVRPYLEDPVWLQPDDDELAMLHDIEVGKEAAAKGEKIQAQFKHEEHH